MRTITIAVVLLSCAASAHAQSSSVLDSMRKAANERLAKTPLYDSIRREASKHAGVIERGYNRFSDTTVTRLTGLRIALPDASASAFFATPGKTPKMPGAVAISFVSRSVNWKYLRCRTLRLLVDGKRMNPAVVFRDSDVLTGGVVEELVAILTVPQFTAIANSKTLEGQLCTDEFSFSTQQIAGFRALADEMGPPR